VKVFCASYDLLAATLIITQMPQPAIAVFINIHA